MNRDKVIDRIMYMFIQMPQNRVPVFRCGLKRVSASPGPIVVDLVVGIRLNGRPLSESLVSGAGSLAAVDETARVGRGGGEGVVLGVVGVRGHGGLAGAGQSRA